MLVGHYSVAFAAKAARPSIPLWQLFIGVQLVDYLWAIFILAGIERAKIVPGFMEASSLDLSHMPYTHSLLAALFWGALAGGFYAIVVAKTERWILGGVMGFAVLSHWLLDLLVHTTDLALFPGGTKVGFGIWNSLHWSLTLEIGLLIVAALLYAVRVRSNSTRTNMALAVFVGALCAVQIAYTLEISPPQNIREVATSALVLYTVLAAVAFGVEKWRGVAIRQKE